MNKLFKTRVIPTAIHRCGRDYVGEITTRPGVKELHLYNVQYKQNMENITTNVMSRHVKVRDTTFQTKFMEEVLHLFIVNSCRHNCPLCCNKFYSIDKIPIVTVELLKSVKTVCLTGGEPFRVKPELLGDFIIRLRYYYPNIENLYIYTSGKEVGTHLAELLEVKDPFLGSVRDYVNGINFAPKDFKDWMGVYNAICSHPLFFSKAYNKNSSNRLYVFKSMRSASKLFLDDINKKFLEGRDLNINVIDRVWTKTFNTPPNEHFARLPILF